MFYQIHFKSEMSKCPMDDKKLTSDGFWNKSYIFSNFYLLFDEWFNIMNILNIVDKLCHTIGPMFYFRY